MLKHWVNHHISMVETTLSMECRCFPKACLSLNYVLLLEFWRWTARVISEREWRDRIAASGHLVIMGVRWRRMVEGWTVDAIALSDNLFKNIGFARDFLPCWRGSQTRERLRWRHEVVCVIQLPHVGRSV